MILLIIINSYYILDFKTEQIQLKFRFFNWFNKVYSQVLSKQQKRKLFLCTQGKKEWD